MQMESHTHHYPANWNLRFMCDCRTPQPELKIYPATVKQLSPYSTRIASSHNICPNRSITLQLEIPPLQNDGHARTLEIIGHTIYTVVEGDYFLTEIEFMRFDGVSQQVLMQALVQQFGNPDG